MSRKKNKSRLTKTDINTIREMQRTIDAYEEYIVGLCYLIEHKGKDRQILMLRDTGLDEMVNSAWGNYICQTQDINNLIGKNDDEVH